MKKIIVSSLVLGVLASNVHANYGTSNQTHSIAVDHSAAQNSNEKKYPQDQFKTEADRELNKKIRSQTDGWFVDSYKAVIIRTADGVVIIEGVVSSPEDQKKLTDEIKKIEGVKAVQNKTVVKAEQAYNSPNSQYGTSANQRYATAADQSESPKSNEKKYPQDQFKTESDRELNKKIRDKTDGWFVDSYKTVIIRTADGVVVIEGVVSSPEDQKKLTDEIKKIEGVKAIQNKTEVKAEQAYNSANSQYGMSNQNYATTTAVPAQEKAQADSQFPNEQKHPQDQYQNPSDRLLNKKIRDKITGWFTDSYKDVVIQTSNGLVVLEGFVTSESNKTDLGNDIRKIEGVKSVQNNVQIKK